MGRLKYFILAFVIWILLTWPFGVTGTDWQVVIAGLIVSVVAAVVFRGFAESEAVCVFASPVRLFWFLVYLPVFFYYVVKANFDVVYRALHPAMPINPGIVKIKTTLKTQAGITALANSITLTPGTLTVDLTDDGFLYIHWINVKATDVEQAGEVIAQRFEWFLTRIFE